MKKSSSTLSDVCDMSVQIQKWAIENGHFGAIQAAIALGNTLGLVVIKAEGLKLKKIMGFLTKK